MKLKTILAVTLLCFFTISRAFASGLVIEKGKKVMLNYTLTVDGKVLDSSAGKEPLIFIYGDMALIPGLEKALLGLKQGDKKHLTFAPQEAYGSVDPKAVIEVPRTNFPAEPEIEPGMVFTSHDPQGGDLNGTVKELRGDKVLLDFNHPLAGKSLDFDVEIVSVV